MNPKTHCSSPRSGGLRHPLYSDLGCRGFLANSNLTLQRSLILHTSEPPASFLPTTAPQMPLDVLQEALCLLPSDSTS